MELCLICENKFIARQKIPARDGYYYLICPHCSGGKLLPRDKALKALKKAYQSTYFDWKEAKGIRKYLNKIQLFTSYSDWIEGQFSDKKGKLLDVGAGIPDFVLKMKKRGWDSMALEISPGQVKLIKKYIGEKKVFKGDFEKIDLKHNFFNVLTFWHMLEHLINPAKAIRKSAGVLKKGGRLYAEFPNFNSLNLKFFRQDYVYFDLPGHLVYYNQKSLKQLFSKNGFEQIEITYPLKLNGSFAFNFSNYLYVKYKNHFLRITGFYVMLPVSVFLSVIFSMLGKSDLMRISAVKK